jgi:hypothetical protein
MPSINQLALPLTRLHGEPEDYANPIEPSGRGGAKIARAIAQSFRLLSQ